MAAFSDNLEIEKRMENVKLNEDELPVEDKYTLDCLKQLDDNETDLNKIANASHQFLLAYAIKNAEKIITECEADGTCSLNIEQRKRKKSFLINLFYKESLKMLKQKLLE